MGIANPVEMIMSWQKEVAYSGILCPNHICNICSVSMIKGMAMRKNRYDVYRVALNTKSSMESNASVEYCFMI